MTQSKDIKEKKMHVDLMRFNSTELMYLKKNVTRVAFLHLIYVVVCSVVNVMIKKY